MLRLAPPDRHTSNIEVFYYPQWIMEDYCPDEKEKHAENWGEEERKKKHSYSRDQSHPS